MAQRDVSSGNLFNEPDADVILRSCDAQDFRVLSLYIIKSSPVLKGLMETTSSNPPIPQSPLSFPMLGRPFQL
jgi:hypothetical protein